MDFYGFNSYGFIIAASLLIIISFFFNILAKKTNIPSVLLLISLGIIIKEAADYLGIVIPDLFPVLEIFGIIGLIMIVLEASLDLKLKREKWPFIWKSFLVASFSLGISSIVIGYILMSFIHCDLFTALIYSIPLSIMSSAIIIPSVAHLEKDKEEFMIYESTFSDILGIMYFYFLIGSVEANGAAEITLDIVTNISFSVIISVVLSYLLIYIFHELGSNVKLFFLISILVLLYSVGKLMHFSALIMILVFGIILNNHQVFFRGRLDKLINKASLKVIYADFNIITIESSFVVRTFFFVIFGMTISLSSLINVDVISISLIILAVLYAIRLLMMKAIVRKDIFPQVLIAPRGLITILLYFAIPTEYIVPEFDSGILLFIIIFSSMIMGYSLIRAGKNNYSLKETVTEKSDEG